MIAYWRWDRDVSSVENGVVWVSGVVSNMKQVVPEHFATIWKDLSPYETHKVNTTKIMKYGEMFTIRLNLRYRTHVLAWWKFGEVRL